MCGRATITDAGEVLPDRFSFSERANGFTVFPPRFNLSPRQDILAVYVDPDSGRPTLRPMHWNLIPGHLRGAEEVARFDRDYSTFNARLERASSAPTFRGPWRRQRCLVVVDGMIEWTGAKGKRVPWRIRRADGAPFAMAGLWDRWRGDAETPEIWSCSVVVGEADDWFARFHHRMARVLAPEHYAAWLDPALTDAAAVAELLASHPYPMDTMVAERISPRVNNPGYDAPELVLPLPA